MSANKAGAQPRTPTGSAAPGSPAKQPPSSDLEKLRELKMTILRGQHPIFRPNPSPDQLAEVFQGAHPAAVAAASKPKSPERKPPPPAPPPPAPVPAPAAAVLVASAPSPVVPVAAAQPPPARSPVIASVNASPQRPAPVVPPAPAPAPAHAPAHTPAHAPAPASAPPPAPVPAPAPVSRTAPVPEKVSRPVIDTSVPSAVDHARGLPASRPQPAPGGTNVASSMSSGPNGNSLPRPLVPTGPAPLASVPVPSKPEPVRQPIPPPAPMPVVPSRSAAPVGPVSVPHSVPAPAPAPVPAPAPKGPDRTPIDHRSPSITTTASPQRPHVHPPVRHGNDSKQSPPFKRENTQGPIANRHQDVIIRRDNGPPPSSGPIIHPNRRDSLNGPQSNSNHGSPRSKGPAPGVEQGRPQISGQQQQQRNSSIERRQTWDRSPPSNARRDASLDRRAPPPQPDYGYVSAPRPYEGDRDHDRGRFESRGRYEREPEQPPAFRRPEPPPAGYGPPPPGYTNRGPPDASPPRSYERAPPREFVRPLDPRPGPGPGPGPGSGPAIYERERDMRAPPTPVMPGSAPYMLPPPRDVDSRMPPPAPPVPREFAQPYPPSSDGRRSVAPDGRLPPPPMHGHMVPYDRERERDLVPADGRRSVVHLPPDDRRPLQHQHQHQIQHQQPLPPPPPPASYADHRGYAPAPPPPEPIHRLPPRSESRASFGGMPPPPQPYAPPAPAAQPEADDEYDPRRPANGIPQLSPVHALESQRHADNMSRAAFREPDPMTNVIRDSVPLREPQPLPREASVLHDIHAHAQLPPPPPPHHAPPPARNGDWRRDEYPPPPPPPPQERPGGEYDRRPPPPSDYYPPPRSASAVPQSSSMEPDPRGSWDGRQWDGSYGRYPDDRDRERGGYGAPPPQQPPPPPARPATSAPTHDYYYNTRPPPEPQQVWAGRARSPSPLRPEDERPYKRFRVDERDFAYERERQEQFAPMRAPYAPEPGPYYEDRAPREHYPPPY